MIDVLNTATLAEVVTTCASEEAYMEIVCPQWAVK